MPVGDPAGGPDSSSFPKTGFASVYDDGLEGAQVATSRPSKEVRYRMHGYSAALLGNHQGAIPLGTHLMLEHQGRRVIVEVNDTGRGSATQDRVLDLSKAAAAALLGKPIDSITPTQAGIIHLDKITVVPGYIRVGP